MHALQVAVQQLKKVNVTNDNTGYEPSAKMLHFNAVNLIH